MMSQSTELSRLLSEARLEGYRENLENDLKVSSIAQLRQLRNYSELAQIGMKKEEIERLRRLLKGNTMSKLKKVIAAIIIIFGFNPEINDFLWHISNPFSPFPWLSNNNNK